MYNDLHFLYRHRQYLPSYFTIEKAANTIILFYKDFKLVRVLECMRDIEVRDVYEVESDLLNRVIEKLTDLVMEKILQKNEGVSLELERWLNNEN